MNKYVLDSFVMFSMPMFHIPFDNKKNFQGIQPNALLS